MSRQIKWNGKRNVCHYAMLCNLEKEIEACRIYWIFLNYDHTMLKILSTIVFSFVHLYLTKTTIPSHKIPVGKETGHAYF